MAAHQYHYYTHYQTSYLNPYAPEFHPLFSSNNSIYNYIYHHRYTNNNINNYSFNYYQTYPHVNNANVFHVHHQINNLNYHGQDYTTMQPPRQLGQQVATSPQTIHIRSSPKRPNTRAWSNGRRSRWAGCNSRSSVINSNSCRSQYCGRKQGFNLNEFDKRRGGDIIKKEENYQMFMAVKPNGVETSAMIRNIPNQYTRDMLIKFLDEFCRIENQRLATNDDHRPLAFDFLYLPTDFKSGANKGYAFVNFTRPTAVWKLHLAYNNQRWEFCKSHKVCNINYATIQGKENLVAHFGRSRFICDHEDYLPVCFNPPRDGSGVSVIETTIGTRFGPEN